MYLYKSASAAANFWTLTLTTSFYKTAAATQQTPSWQNNTNTNTNIYVCKQQARNWKLHKTLYYKYNRHKILMTLAGKILPLIYCRTCWFFLRAFQINIHQSGNSCGSACQKPTNLFDKWLYAFVCEKMVILQSWRIIHTK